MSLDLTAPESRYSRQELITWWDQSRLATGRVLVVGAGALGNELLKSLALLGVGAVHVVDMDVVERTNLARCVLFREEDEGRPKALVAAERASELNPDVTVTGEVASVLDLGLGRFGDFDVVLGGLDNREARLFVNQACRKLGLPWVDGAIEGLRGLVRVFMPEGSCYECTLGETDRRILAHRRSCALLSPEEMESGKTPTNATTAAIVAAIQVQEAVKLLVARVDLLALCGSALVINGDTLETYVVAYPEDEWCAAHDRYDHLNPVKVGKETTLGDLVEQADLPGGVQAVDLEAEYVLSVSCGECALTTVVRRPLNRMAPGSLPCPDCGAVRALDVRTSLLPDDELVALPVRELDLPEASVVTLRSGAARVHHVLEGLS